MLIFKVVGALMVLACGAGLALGAARYERARLQVHDGLILLLFFIKGRIDCYAMPAEQILLEMDKGILADCRCPGQIDSIEALLPHVKSYLDAETYRVLQAFGQGLGGGFRDEQIKRCDYYIELLRQKRMQLESDLSVRVKANGMIWILCAVGAVILLW
jgi:hypothetical protein